MTLNVRYADDLFGLSFEVMARLPGRSIPLDSASGAAFLATRALTIVSADGSIPFGADDLLWHMSFARTRLPSTCMFEFDNNALCWKRPYADVPGVPTLTIDPDLGTIGVGDVVFEWQDLRRWTAAACGHQPRQPSRKLADWQLPISATVTMVAVQLSLYAQTKGITWFEAACQLTREILKHEICDPDNLLDIISPNAAMSRGYCVIDPFAKTSVLSTGHQLGLKAFAFSGPLDKYAKILSSMQPSHMELTIQAIAANLGEGNYDQIDRTISAHGRIALDDRLAKLTDLAREVVTAAERRVPSLTN